MHVIGLAIFFAYDFVQRLYNLTLFQAMASSELGDFELNVEMDRRPSL
jgi:hypothetical protein